MKTIVGLYDDFETAQNVVKDLVNAGFDRANISVLANDAEGRHSSTIGSTTTSTDTDHASGAASGAAGGAVVGGIGGLLLGLGALAIPGLGPIIAAGPIVAALTGAGIGAAAGGVLGALTDLGVPDEEAEYYAEGVRRGGTLVTLKTSEDLMERAIDIMDNHGAVDIQDRVENWKQSGWKGFNPNEQHYTPDQVTKFREEQKALVSTATPRATTTQTTQTTTTTPATTNTNTNEQKIPVVEEQLRVGKREVEQGGVRVRTYVQQKPVEEKINLREEHVSVERHPVDKNVNPADLDRAFKNETIEMTEKSEEAVVDKKAKVVEEVVVKKDVTDRTETIKDTVRRTDVEVENVGGQRTTTGTTFEKYQPVFQTHYNKQFASSGRGFDTYQPAYKYGFDLANNQKYASSEWPSIEADARRDWETRGQGPWEDFKDAVREGYQNVKSNVKEGYQDTKDAVRRNL